MNKTSGGSINSQAAHHNLQKSTTLNRRYVRRPTKITINADEEPKEIKKTAKKISIVDDKPVKAEKTAKKISISDDTSKQAAEEQAAKLAIEQAEAERKAAEKAAEKARKAAEEAEAVAKLAAEEAAAEQEKLAAAEREIAKFEQASKAAAELQNDTTALEKAAEEAGDLPPAPNPYQVAINRSRKTDGAGQAVEKTAQELKEEAIAKSIAETETRGPLTKKELKAIEREEQAAAKAKKAVTKKTAKKAAGMGKAAKGRGKKVTQTLALSKVAKKFEAEASGEQQRISRMSRSMRKASNGKRFLVAFSASAAVVAVLGLLVAINIPDVSVRVAAMQTGIEASYPSYVPRGFQLSAVHTDEKRSVIMDFSNTDGNKFTITEEKSSWDSNALLNNYVKPEWGDKFTVIREQGITIYTYNSNATWVNGGIVYSLTSNSNHLTKKQIKNIVTSL